MTALADPSKISVDLYYDYRSPYAYFLSRFLPDFAAQRSLNVCWRPVSVSILLNLQVDKDPWAAYEDPLPPIKRAYLLSDVRRRARYLNIPLKTPASLNSLSALKVSLLLKDDPVEPVFRERVWHALWVEQRDVSDLDVLRRCVEGEDKNAIQRVEQALDAASPQPVETASLDAFRAGIFGVPSFKYGDEVLFGSDQLPLLDRMLTATRR